jgi:hypothetical protein
LARNPGKMIIGELKTTMAKIRGAFEDEYESKDGV